jgi:hypothetical protein
MPSHAGPKNPVKENLIFALDAADKKNSFLPFSTFLNMSSWALGSGGTGPYSQNGNTDENERVNGTDPWGNAAIVWESRPNGSGQADGGWNTGFYTVDETKTYRWSVWVKRTSTSTGGTSYMGLYGNPNAVVRLQNGAQQGNPYWECNGTSAYTKDVWYLLVGHCFPSNYTGTLTTHPDTGRYTVNGRNGDLNYCNIGGDVKWYPGTTGGYHRVYHYYCADNTTRLQWYDPRLEVCDGTEPTINDLLRSPATYGRSLVSSAQGTLVNGTVWNRSNQGTFAFDGTNDYIEIPFENILTDCTFELVFKATSTALYQYPLAIRNNSVGSSYAFYMDMNDPDGSSFAQTMWTYWNSGGSPNSVIPKTGTYGDWNDSTWRHYVFTRSTTNSPHTFHYMNGNLVPNINRSGDQTTQFGNGSGYKLYLGSINGSGGFFSGNLPIVNIYNTALSADQIKQNYNKYKSRFNLS